jgi:hypothetical protein
MTQEPFKVGCCICFSTKDNSPVPCQHEEARKNMYLQHKEHFEEIWDKTKKEHVERRDL